MYSPEKARIMFVHFEEPENRKKQVGEELLSWKRGDERQENVATQQTRIVRGRKTSTGQMRQRHRNTNENLTKDLKEIGNYSNILTFLLMNMKILKK